MPPVPPGGTHPVNLDYLTAQTSGQAKLRPVSLLPPEIRLVNGRVECVSCHDLSASGAPRLVMGMHRSRLCFACHAL
jgi:predicted CXXCH cytochrome family protein